MSLTSNLMVHSDIVAPYILHLGSEEQKRKYLPQMISGECFGALAMTEPGTGSDLQAIKTNAQPDGDGYRLNGSKTFIPNGQHAGVVIVAAKEIGRAPVCNPVTHAHLVCRLLLQHKKHNIPNTSY